MAGGFRFVVWVGCGWQPPSPSHGLLLRKTEVSRVLGQTFST